MVTRPTPKKALAGAVLSSRPGPLQPYVRMDENALDYRIQTQLPPITPIIHRYHHYSCVSCRSDTPGFELANDCEAVYYGGVTVVGVICQIAKPGARPKTPGMGRDWTVIGVVRLRGGYD